MKSPLLRSKAASPARVCFSTARSRRHFLAALAGGASLLAWPAAAASKHHAEADEADQFFASEVPPHLVIEVAPDDYETLRAYRWQQGGGQRPEVKATVKAGGTVYHDVALHPKGSYGSSRPITARPALTLHFDKFVPGQLFQGLGKISLNNSAQDPSFVREALCRELFNELDVPTPRAGHALVTLNGVLRGYYVVLEGADKRFLRRHFSDPSGTLYDGGFARDIDAGLDITSGGKEHGGEDLSALARTAWMPDPVRRYATLAKLVDLERFQKMMALEALIAHYDGYSQNRNNYRVYHDPRADQLVFIPHGMDLILLDRKLENPLIPHCKGMVSAGLISTPAGRRRHVALLNEYSRSIFTAAGLTARAGRLAQRVERGMAELEKVSASPGVRRLDRNYARMGYREAAAQLREVIEARCGFIQDVLAEMNAASAGPAPAPK